MAHKHTPMLGNQSAVYYIPPEDDSNQSAAYYVPPEDDSTQTTDRGSSILVNTPNANPPSVVEELISHEKTQEASTQTPWGDLRLFQQPLWEISEESRKRKISNGQEAAHGSPACKLPRTESSDLTDPLVSSLNLLTVYSGDSEITNTEQNVALEKSDASGVGNVFLVEMQAAFRAHVGVVDWRKFFPTKESEFNQKMSRCLDCQKPNSEHGEDHDGKELYRCCRCSSTHHDMSYLQKHIFERHFKPLYCKVCELRYSEMYLHGRDESCYFCYQNFECKYRLYDHIILFHKGFLKNNCRICYKNFDEHSISKKERHERYQCCFRNCKKWTNSTLCLNVHLNKHFPLKLFRCKICGDHFKRFDQLEVHQSIHPFHFRGYE